MRFFDFVEPTRANHPVAVRTLMRRLILTSSYPAGPGDPSGHFIRSEARQLARSGEQVWVLAAGGDRRAPVEHHDGVSLAWLGGRGVFGWPGAAERLRRAPWRVGQLAELPFGLRQHLTELGAFDRVTAHWLLPSAFPLLHWLDATPADGMVHGADLRLLLAMPARLRLTLTGWLLDRLDHIRFAAASGRDAWCHALPAATARRLRAKSFVEPAGIELEITSFGDAELARRFGLSASLPLIASVGRLVPGKRVDLAIEAAARLAPGAQLAIVGDGPERQRLERLAHRHGLEARFLGRLPRADTLGVVAKAAALLHTSSSEAAPTAVREARALGVAVVATASGDLQAWSQGDAALTLAAPKPDALAAALRSALTARAGHSPSAAVANELDGFA